MARAVFTFSQDLQIRKGSFTALYYSRVVGQQQPYGEVFLEFLSNNFKFLLTVYIVTW
jgi:hypothetical protein